MTIFVMGAETVFNQEYPISPLLLPVDGSAPGFEAVRQGDPRLTLLHVIDYAILAPAYAEGAAPLIADGEEILTNGREILKDTGLKGMVADKLLIGQPAQVIAEEAEGAHYALILMGAGGIAPQTSDPGQCLQRCAVSCLPDYCRDCLSLSPAYKEEGVHENHYLDDEPGR
jgi:hypothetical protein